MKSGFLCAAVCLAPAIVTGQVSSLSNTGTLTSPQSAAYITFQLIAADSVTFKTWGFGGGTNAAGTVIPAGGFDPMIALFSGTIATANIYLDGSNNPVASADNLSNAPWSIAGNCPAAGTVQIGANSDCGDVKIQLPLAAGTYTLLVTDANYQPGAIYQGGAISGPFVDLTGGGAQFQTCDPVANACVNRNGAYAVDIVGTKASLVGFSKCDINQDMTTNAADAELIVKQALGVNSPSNDLNADGTVNVVDVQIAIQAIRQLGCSAK